jgi:Septum formation
VERKCVSCGADPGEGAFCQHCGTRQPTDGTPVPDNPPASDPPFPPVSPAPPPTPPQVPAATPPLIPGQPVPAPTPPQVPAATPPLISGQPVPAKRSGCRSGCLIVGVVAVVLVVVGGFLAWRFFRNEVLPGIQETVDEVGTFADTPPGPCYDLETDNGLLTGWTEVPCSGPRQVEVSFSASFEDGPFPGDAYLTDTAADTCVASFERYVGISPEQSAYDADWLLPTEDMWASGSRQGICLVVSDDGSALTGTVKGSDT